MTSSTVTDEVDPPLDVLAKLDEVHLLRLIKEIEPWLQSRVGVRPAIGGTDPWPGAAPR